eukprot:CAMPEP_0181303118 /NCGR_PEP_ID=MMETSP1101-20121128/8374_1 /TAXON_ID=46948 /ORGANISM="Rhodomonas abbreviata, Strain Caron Lab Isolate" /LENGTH=629 /DNA_ID=CAMNT_0023408643 /DNA_START=83 /DNA_END=1972 /DNA_ORIENTATION=-
MEQTSEDEWMVFEDILSSHRQREIAAREEQTNATLHAMRKGDDQRHRQKSLAAHLKRDSGREVEDGPTDKNKVKEVLTKHLLHNLQKARSAGDQRHRQKSLAAHLKRDIEREIEDGPTGKEKIKEVLTKHLLNNLQKARSAGDTGLENRKREAGEERERREEGMKKPLFAGVSGDRWKAILNQHLLKRMKKQHATPSDFVRMDTRKRVRVEKMLEIFLQEHLRKQEIHASHSCRAHPGRAPVLTGQKLTQLLDVFIEVLDLDKHAVYDKIDKLTPESLKHQLLSERVGNTTHSDFARTLLHNLAIEIPKPPPPPVLNNVVRFTLEQSVVYNRRHVWVRAGEVWMRVKEAAQVPAFSSVVRRRIIPNPPPLPVFKSVVRFTLEQSVEYDRRNNWVQDGEAWVLANWPSSMRSSTGGVSKFREAALAVMAVQRLRRLRVQTVGEKVTSEEVQSTSEEAQSGKVQTNEVTAEESPQTVALNAAAKGGVLKFREAALAVMAAQRLKRLRKQRGMEDVKRKSEVTPVCSPETSESPPETSETPPKTKSAPETWTCRLCTLINKRAAQICQVCENPRVGAEETTSDSEGSSEETTSGSEGSSDEESTSCSSSSESSGEEGDEEELELEDGVLCWK